MICLIYFQLWNYPTVLKYLKQYEKIITIEEQNLPGGIGSIISEIIAENNINVPLKRCGIDDRYILKCGNRDWLKNYSLDEKTLYKNIKNFCDKKLFKFKGVLNIKEIK